MQAGVIAVVAAGLYGGTLAGSFVLDDRMQVERNPWIRDVRHLPDMFTKNVWAFRGDGMTSNYYRPMMHVIYMTSRAVLGPEPWGFHLVNLLLHAGCSVLLLFLVERLQQGADPAAPGIPEGPWRSLPFLSALLFACHPVHAEAVAWIASVPELSYTAAVLGALVLHASSQGDGLPRRAGVVALFALGLLCKEPALVLPALMGALDLVLGRPLRPMRYVPLAAVAIVYLLVRHAVLRATIAPVRWGDGDVGAGWLPDTLPLLAAYTRALVLPTSLHYWHPLQTFHTLSALQGAAVLLLVAAILGAVLWSWRRRPLVLFGLAVTFLPLLPALYIPAIPGKPYAERYLYLPSAGFTILAALGLRELASRIRVAGVAFAAAAALAAAYGIAAVRQAAAWQDVYALYQDNVREAPSAPVPCEDLCDELLFTGRIDEAIAAFRQAVAADPRSASCRSALGSALVAKGSLEEAVTHLEQAVVMDPQSLPARNDLAVALGRLGRTTEAMAAHREILAISPDYAEAHFNLASLLGDDGQAAEALRHYETAVRLAPADVLYRNGLGIEYGRQGRLDDAITQFEEALRIDPSEPASASNLAHARELENAPPPYPEPWIDEARAANGRLACQELIYKRECAELRTGTVELSVTVDPDGRVTAVEVLRNEIRNDPEVVEACLRQKVPAWQFHPPQGAQSTFPLLLRFSDTC